MISSILNPNACRDAERAKARAWRCPLESVIPGQVHTTAPDKRPLKQEDVAYLGPSSQGVVGAVVCQKCYNRRTTAKRKEAKRGRDEETETRRQRGDRERAEARGRGKVEARRQR